ncbi:hypothetical protein DFJ77DRAFT_443117 [Powellomyces hirtus]|nr:hypothetical protein DFJ77DRAFT_443117 [Powellomyces hirtus]
MAADANSSRNELANAQYHFLRCCSKEVGLFRGFHVVQNFETLEVIVVVNCNWWRQDCCHNGALATGLRLPSDCYTLRNVDVTPLNHLEIHRLLALFSVQYEPEGETADLAMYRQCKRIYIELFLCIVLAMGMATLSCLLPGIWIDNGKWLAPMQPKAVVLIVKDSTADKSHLAAQGSSRYEQGALISVLVNILWAERTFRCRSIIGASPLDQFLTEDHHANRFRDPQQVVTSVSADGKWPLLEAR